MISIAILTERWAIELCMRVYVKYCHHSLREVIYMKDRSKYLDNEYDRIIM